jgi:hypothetical protein
MSFFGNLNNHLRVHLRHIEIRAYVKKDARNALTFLAEARGLEHLRLEVDVVKDDDPVHAAGLFWPDVCKLLEAVGSRIEKSMVLPRKVTPQEPEVEQEEPSQEEQSESESESEVEDEGEGEGEGEDEDAGNDTEKTDETAKSDNAEAKDSDGDVAMSPEPKDAEDIKSDTGESDNHKPAEVKAEETHTSDAVEKNSEKTPDDIKQDSKYPIPVAPIKKKKTDKPEPPKRIQGKKCFAVDILHFGPKALMNKDGKTPWDNAKKQEFLTALEGKLK